jgi:DNA-directed RNA polymerase specialized sigma24 family protein
VLFKGVATTSFATRVEGERPYLLRYASLQLRDAQAAEDAVQETLLAALAGEAGFAGRSNLRTWLTGTQAQDRRCRAPAES